MATPYETGLDRNAANFQPLTPLSFLARAAEIYPDQTAIIHGKRSWTYRQFFARTRQMASALARRGIDAANSRSGTAECAGDAGGALRRRHGGRRAQFDQYPARRRHHRFPSTTAKPRL